MIKNKFILLLLGLMFLSCKAQDIRIIIEDNVFVDDKEIYVFQIKNENDTINLKSVRPEYYHLDKRIGDMKLIIKYKTNIFMLSDIREITKCIYVNYKNDAEENCYVINEMFSDALQSQGLNNLNNCSDITNIYLYSEFEPKIIKMDVKIRKKK